MDIDVALLPQVANPADAGVCVAIDEIRASTTITTLLDGGCRAVYLAGDPPAARRLAAETGSLLVGEHHAVKPPDFDFDNSPVELAAADLRGRSVVLSTTNGTALLARIRRTEPVLVGCIRNARAVAAAALTLAMAGSRKVRILCAGREGLFVLDDAVAAGLIAGRVADAARLARCEPRLSDAAVAAIRLSRSWPDLLSALEASDGGETLRQIGAEPDIAYCAEEDATATVPIVRYEGALRAEPLEA